MYNLYQHRISLNKPYHRFLNAIASLTIYFLSWMNVINLQNSKRNFWCILREMLGDKMNATVKKKKQRINNGWWRSIMRKSWSIETIFLLFCYRLSASFSQSYQGQVKGIWTYHLKKAKYHEGPLFLRPHCGPTSEHTSYSKVSNERYVHYLSNDTP